MFDEFSPERLRPRDLRRFLADMWNDPRCDQYAERVISAAFAMSRRSLDRIMIMAWLGMTRADHPARARLGDAVRLVVGRHPWNWQERGARWQLWDDVQAPRTIATALLTSDDPKSVLAETGIEGDLLHGCVMQRALLRCCEVVQGARGPQAETQGQRLIALFDSVGAGHVRGALALALLVPWQKTTPGDAYRKILLDFILRTFGDPRSEGLLAASLDDPRKNALVDLVRRWLTERSFKQFFNVVRKTTNNIRQWDEREEFWTAYLNAGRVSEAWFALGRDAERMIATRFKMERHEYGVIEGSSGVEAGSSGIIIRIGSLVLAEWSDNGSCRFWPESDRQKPALYKKQYFNVWLRAMNGGPGFEYIPHLSSWQWRFAHKIYKETGIEHPRFKTGLKF